MSLEKLPSGRWRGVVRHNATKRTTATFDTKAEAKKAEAELLLNLGDELGPSVRRPTSVGSMTVAELTTLHQGQAKFSGTYLAEYKRYGKKLPTSITGRVVSGVTPMHAVRWWAQLKKDGWTEGSVFKAHAYLSSAFTQAVKFGLVRSNPLRDVAPPRPAPAEIILPTVETIAKIVKALNRNRDEPCFAAFVYVIMATGVRRGECIGLKWGDITELDGVSRITVRRAVSYTPATGVIVKETKTNAKGRRTIPLNADAVAALKAWKAVQADLLTIEAVMPEAFIFSKTGDEPRRPDWAQIQWTDLCDIAEVKCHLHDLRHAFVSGLLEAGENPVRVARLAGHSRTSTTLDIYGHLQEG